jgi:hypothetical protein
MDWKRHRLVRDGILKRTDRCELILRIRTVLISLSLTSVSSPIRIIFVLLLVMYPYLIVSCEDIAYILYTSVGKSNPRCISLLLVVFFRLATKMVRHIISIYTFLFNDV